MPEHRGVTMPGRVAIRLLAWAGGADFQPGVYLKSWNHDDNGKITAETFTRNIEQAMTFPSVGEALTFWRGKSKTKPFRVDGKPNRPLTVFTITFDSAEDKTFWSGLVNRTRNDDGH